MYCKDKCGVKLREKSPKYRFLSTRKSGSYTTIFLFVCYVVLRVVLHILSVGMNFNYSWFLHMTLKDVYQRRTELQFGYNSAIKILEELKLVFALLLLTVLIFSLFMLRTQYLCCCCFLYCVLPQIPSIYSGPQDLYIFLYSEIIISTY